MITKDDDNEDIRMKFEDGIQTAKVYFRNISEKSKNAQSYLNKIAEQADNSLMSVYWRENNILPNLNNLQNNPEFKSDIKESYDSLMQSVNWACKVVEELGDLDKPLNIAASGVNVAATTATIAPNMLFAHVNTWNSRNPQNTIIMQPPDFDRSVTEMDLDQRLGELDPSNNLVESRKGAWQSFHSGFFLNLKSACHLMRGILTYLLDNISENDLVKQADWWSSAKDTNEGVSKRQKIRYLICEQSYVDIDSDLTIIESNIDQCKKIHDELCAVAHNKPGYQDSVKRYLSSMEDILLNILEHRHRIQQFRKT
jgi:hypothetical protein